MRRNGRWRNYSSKALIELREALGLTQGNFADKVGCAETTIAHYETSHPPSGAALLRFRDIAMKAGLDPLAERFEGIFLQEVVNELQGRIEKVYVDASSEALFAGTRQALDELKAAL